MRTSAQVEITWDSLAAAWRLTAGRAGAAGATEVELGGCTWWFDWLEPSRLVEALVVVPEDSAGSPIPQPAVDVAARLCGDEVARALVALPASGATRTTANLVESSGGARATAGRLAVALASSEDRSTPSWWTVEAAAAAIALGSLDAADLAQQAFDVVDRLPEDLYQRLAAADLVGPLRSVLIGVGLVDADLPEPLRLGAPDVDQRFAELVDRLELAPAVLTADLGVPTFRDASKADRRAAADERAVDWIDVPAGAVRRAVWRPDAAGPTVHVALAGPAPEWLRVRLVELSGRVPVVLQERRLQATGTNGGVTTTTARFDPVERPGELRVELVDRTAELPLADPLRARRHATNLTRTAVVSERAADAEARIGSEHALDAARLAARQWSAALDAWESIGSAGQASVCRAHRRRLLDHVGAAPSAGAGRSTARDAPIGTTGAAVAGWSESVIAEVRAHLADSSTVGVEPRRSEAQAASLASLAESVDDVELAARFRVEQVRALPTGDLRSVIASIALTHFDHLGVRPPRDLDPLGAAGG